MKVSGVQQYNKNMLNNITKKIINLRITYSIQGTKEHNLTSRSTTSESITT